MSTPSRKPASRLQEVRIAAKLTQEQVAERVPAPLESYKKWDRGLNTPRRQTMRRLAEIFETNVEDIFPNAYEPPTPAAPAAPTAANGRSSATPGIPAGSGPGVPIPAFLGTADQTGWRPAIPRFSRPAALPGRRTAVAMATVLILAGGTAVVASGSDEPTEREPARAAVPSPRQRAAGVVAREIHRGDYDAAITAALSVRDIARANEIRTQAVRILLERVDTAITARKLGRARTLLGRAKTKYGDRLPDESAERYAHIHKLDAAAAARAKARADAKRRAAKAKARARRHAAARAAAGRQAASRAAPQSSPSPVTPKATTRSTPAPSTQSNPAPQSSGGSAGSSGGSSGGGGSSSKKPVDPGIY